MDLNNKVDLLVRPNLGIGDIVLGGVQVKPTFILYSKRFLDQDDRETQTDRRGDTPSKINTSFPKNRAMREV